mmetsp:Transcript_104016/g.238145  ORF Transcript_104016/g.238145 Transcript_104016/m.238145 type:complete len:276 (-) Transcript_104016:236-1063(-)
MGCGLTKGKYKPEGNGTSESPAPTADPKAAAGKEPEAADKPQEPPAATANGDAPTASPEPQLQTPHSTGAAWGRSETSKEMQRKSSCTITTEVGEHHVGLNGDMPSPAPKSAPKKRMSFNTDVEVHVIAVDAKPEFAEGDEDVAMTPKNREPLDATTVKLLNETFDKMDVDFSGQIDFEEAVSFWGSNFGKVNARAMFTEVVEVSEGDSTVITKELWMAFWQQVKQSGYTDEEISTEVKNIMDGGSWVDWKDNRIPAHVNSQSAVRSTKAKTSMD